MNSGAKPLPDPMGMIPKGILRFKSAEATSLMVPSPPMAIILVAPSDIAISVNSEACFTRSVFQTLELGIALSDLTIRSLFCKEFVPAFGFRIK